MNSEDHLYGCRSGIQKAIRRGDLDLVHTCFETLWEEKKQRDWLIWRSTILVAEEAWQLIGEHGELIESKSKDKEEWRKHIYALCLATKSKDAVGLWGIVHNDVEYRKDHKEFDEMEMWRSRAVDGDFIGLADEMHRVYPWHSEYERKGADALLRKTKMGGRGDRIF